MWPFTDDPGGDDEYPRNERSRNEYSSHEEDCPECRRNGRWHSLRWENWYRERAYCVFGEETVLGACRSEDLIMMACESMEDIRDDLANGLYEEDDVMDPYDWEVTELMDTLFDIRDLPVTVERGHEVISCLPTPPYVQHDRRRYRGHR